MAILWRHRPSEIYFRAKKNPQKCNFDKTKQNKTRKRNYFISQKKKAQPDGVSGNRKCGENKSFHQLHHIGLFCHIKYLCFGNLLINGHVPLGTAKEVKWNRTRIFAYLSGKKHIKIRCLQNRLPCLIDLYVCMNYNNNSVLAMTHWMFYTK